MKENSKMKSIKESKELIKRSDDNFPESLNM